jgi:hypothetical protein
VGDLCDIALVHGISHTDAFNSVWLALDAVNTCPQLAIQFPVEHQKQREIASGFLQRSSAGFACCTGAIDGTLIWIEKPKKGECNKAH